MNILVINDDGYEAEGIKLLVESMKEHGSIFVMSPEKQQSGASHSITLHTCVKIHERDNFGKDVKAWSIEGTPADCVIYAVKYLKLDIDLVVSGINDGPNIGTDTLYSGTLAGAMEGLVEHIPAMAFSADYGSFDLAKAEMKDLLKMIFNEKLYSTDYVLNINFPSNKFAKVKGTKITKQGFREMDVDFVEEGDKVWPKVKPIYTEDKPYTDLNAFMNGYISLCALGPNRTHAEGTERLKNISGLEE